MKYAKQKNNNKYVEKIRLQGGITFEQPPDSLLSHTYAGFGIQSYSYPCTDNFNFVITGCSASTSEYTISPNRPTSEVESKLYEYLTTTISFPKIVRRLRVADVWDGYTHVHRMDGDTERAFYASDTTVGYIRLFYLDRYGA